MINLKDEINSLSNFKRNTSEFLEQMRASGKPIVLTINGKAEIVVQDAGSYQKLLELAERIETIEAVKPAIAEMNDGKGESFDKVLEELLENSPEVAG
ncbi:MAG: type II toxin-antitoxin system Phd/YefM family antitoxin [Pyrinomonadaceae bacterium]|nr:type II toxin-antitoxin system Phd/YefM family antitoxin [Pyrinomonadaceae bacterium]